jgi:hypothetical protein
MSETFYRDLTPFESFNDLVEDRHFKPVPPDWTVFVTDVAGSTKAIEAGQYKDVNTLGASCIVAVQNAMGREPFPYVFGGDGATLLVPASASAKVAAALAGVRRMARERFGLTLRVGSVGVSELLAEGARIEVARYRLVSAQSITIFRGGGVSRAEEKVKAAGGRHLLSEDVEGEGDLEGLSCRWNPIPNRNGTMLALLVSGRTSEPPRTYREVLKGLDAILGGDTSLGNPVHLPAMSYRSLPQLLRDESRYHRSLLSPAFLLRAGEIALAVLVFGGGWRVPGLDTGAYSASMRSHADFRKFDDVLRMVVDCTAEQSRRIREMLEAMRLRGEIFYGLHESESALMTCFVYGLADGEHIHFIDGGGGGYALAAREFKAQQKDAGTA